MSEQLHRVEFDVFDVYTRTGRRHAVDVMAEGGDDAASKGQLEALRISAGGGVKILSIYPVPPGTPLREGVLGDVSLPPFGQAAPEPEPKVVDEAAEKAALLAEALKASSAETRPAVEEDAPPADVDDRDVLRAALAAKGVDFDKRWGAARLREVLDAAA